METITERRGVLIGLEVWRTSRKLVEGGRIDEGIRAQAHSLGLVWMLGVLAGCCAFACALVAGMALAANSGLPVWIEDVVLAIGVVVLAVVLIGVVLFAARSNARAEAAFSAVVSRTAAQLEAGTLARVRVVIEPPTSLTVPLIGAGCAYYRAAALVLINGGETPDYWAEDRVRWDGEIARARDSSGEMELDLRAGVDVIGKNALHRIDPKEPRVGDPLGVGLWAYKVELQYLQAGDQVEVVGRVERGADGRYRIVPAKRRLQVRVVAAGKSSA